MSANARTLFELLHSERPILLSLARRIVGSFEAAEDVTQTAWFRLQTVDDTPHLTNPRAYLYRLVLNLARDRLRSERRGEALEAQAQELLWGADTAFTPERILASADLLERVRAAAQAMDEPTRTIFRLSRFEGLTYKEIAGRVGLSTTSVENHIKRALVVLARVRDGVGE